MAPGADTTKPCPERCCLALQTAVAAGVHSSAVAAECKVTAKTCLERCCVMVSCGQTAVAADAHSSAVALECEVTNRWLGFHSHLARLR